MSGDIGKPMSGWERVRGVSSSQGSGQEVQESEEECDCQAYVRHVQGRRSNAQSSRSAYVHSALPSKWTVTASRDGQGARRTHPFATTMFRSASRETRSAIRLLGDSKTSQNLRRLNTSSLRRQHLLLNSSLTFRDQISIASTSVPTSRLQSRQFTSPSRNSTRHFRSGDRLRKATLDERPAGTANDDLPRKARKANPFLPFQASSFVDAFVTTIVGVGISEFCRYKRAR